MRYLLVCEGACNPGLGKLETGLRARRATTRWGGLSVNAPAALTDADVRALRALVHTWHAATVGAGEYACEVCGRVRRY